MIFFHKMPDMLLHVFTKSLLYFWGISFRAETLKNQHFGGHQPKSTQNNQSIFTFHTTLIFSNLIPKAGKSYTGEATACFKTGKKPVWRS